MRRGAAEGDKVDKGDKAEKPERTGKAEKADKTEKDKGEKGEKVARGHDVPLQVGERRQIVAPHIGGWSGVERQGALGTSLPDLALQSSWGSQFLS